MPNSLLFPLLVCALVLALAFGLTLVFVVAQYIGLGTIWRGLLNRLPGRAKSFEKAYLEAIDSRLGNTPALLVISGSDASRRNLKLLDAFSPITLRPDSDMGIGDRVPADDTVVLGRVNETLGGGRPGPSLRRQVATVALWLLAQVLPLALVLALCLWLLWSPADGWRWAWPPIAGAVVAAVIWFLIARWIHTQLVDDDKLDDLLDWWAERSQCTADSGTPGDEIWRHPRLLVRGDPGSGKTTLLRHIAVICARDLLGLAQRHKQDRVRDAYGWPTRLFPIYIPLRSLSFAASQSGRPLLESYVETLATVFGPSVQGCASGFFVQCVKQGGCLILLDAFDELPSADARTQLGNLIADLARIQPRRPNWIVVTSRIVGYEGQLDGAEFVHRRVDELDDGQVADFITARYLAIAAAERRSLGLSEDAGLTWRPQQRADLLIRRLPENPGLSRLSRNPLLLSLAVAVHHDQRDKGQDLPQERYRLYEEAVKLLVNDWEQRKQAEFNPEPGGEIGDLNIDEKVRLLRELAWAMFEQALSASDGRAHTVVSASAARAVLARTLEQIPGFAPEKAGEARLQYCLSEVARVLQRLNQRGGVLQELGNIPGTSDAQIQFAHLTFQEYLAARAAASEQQEQRRARLLRYWNDPRWREVVLLYAASSDATPVVAHLLEQASPESWLLAGAVLIERPIRLDQRRQSETLAELHEIALNNADVSEANAIEALRQLGEMNAVPEHSMLLAATTDAPYAQARAQAIRWLVGEAHEQPDAPSQRLVRPSAVSARRGGRAGSRVRVSRTIVPARPTVPPALPPVEAPVQAALLHVLEGEQDFRPRLAAGFALARNDPRYGGDGWIPDLVEVPVGPFLMGEGEEQHTVEIPYAYSIGKTPVTVGQWRRFAESGGYETEHYWTKAGWHFITGQPESVPSWNERLTRVFRRTSAQQDPYRWRGPERGDDNLPVAEVSWYEAVAYCRWLSEVSGQTFYLPSAAEWEKAARGPQGLIYPWGNDWQDGYCNSIEVDIRRVSPVGSFPVGASPYGALDMAGNVLEWCATKYGKQYPYELEDERDKRYLEGAEARWIRGGSYGGSQKVVRGASRYYDGPRSRGFDIGLRVASRSPRPNAES